MFGIFYHFAISINTSSCTRKARFLDLYVPVNSLFSVPFFVAKVKVVVLVSVYKTVHYCVVDICTSLIILANNSAHRPWPSVVKKNLFFLLALIICSMVWYNGRPYRGLIRIS